MKRETIKQRMLIIIGVIVLVVLVFVLRDSPLKTSKRVTPSQPYASSEDLALMRSTGVDMASVKGIVVIQDGRFREHSIAFATQVIPAQIPIAFINADSTPISVVRTTAGIQDTLKQFTIPAHGSQVVLLNDDGLRVYTLEDNRAEQIEVQVVKLKSR